MGGFAELATAAAMRDLVTSIVTSTVDRIRPKYRYATVNSIDRPNRTAMVTYTGEADPVQVNMGAIQPNTTGQTVRVEGIPPDRFIADVMGTPYGWGGGGGGGDPVSYEHTQTIPNTVWTINHGLGYNPAVSVEIGGVEWETDTDWPTVNQVVLTFATAQTGKAYLS